MGCAFSRAWLPSRSVLRQTTLSNREGGRSRYLQRVLHALLIPSVVRGRLRSADRARTAVAQKHRSGVRRVPLMPRSNFGRAACSRWIERRGQIRRTGARILGQCSDARRLNAPKKKPPKRLLHKETCRYCLHVFATPAERAKADESRTEQCEAGGFRHWYGMGGLDVVQQDRILI